MSARTAHSTLALTAAAVLAWHAANPAAIAQIRAPLFEERVVDFIVERSKVTDAKVSKEDLMKDPEGEE